MDWVVQHTFGIPYTPTGQAIVERMHHSLKLILDQQKGGLAQAAPQMRLSKALYVYNFSSTEPDPPIFRYFFNNTQSKLKENGMPSHNCGSCKERRLPGPQFLLNSSITE